MSTAALARPVCVEDEPDRTALDGARGPDAPLPGTRPCSHCGATASSTYCGPACRDFAFRSWRRRTRCWAPVRELAEEHRLTKGDVARRALALAAAGRATVFVDGGRVVAVGVPR